MMAQHAQLLQSQNQQQQQHQQVPPPPSQQQQQLLNTQPQVQSNQATQQALSQNNNYPSPHLSQQTHAFSQVPSTGGVYMHPHGGGQSVGGAVYHVVPAGSLPSNVYVHNVTANVNLHGYPVPQYIPGTGQTFMPSEVQQSIAHVTEQQNASMMQQTTTNVPMPRNHQRRSRGRGNNGNNHRRNDYNNQRQQQHSPVPQEVLNSQTVDPQILGGYIQYGYPYSYFGTPPQNVAAHPQAQQATGSPLYVAASHLPMFAAGPQMYSYPGVIYHPTMLSQEYSSMVDEKGEEQQQHHHPEAAANVMPQMWPIPTGVYHEEYLGHELIEDVNHNNHLSSPLTSSDTPSMLSPQPYPIYDTQIPSLPPQIQQQMNALHMYEAQTLSQSLPLIIDDEEQLVQEPGVTTLLSSLSCEQQQQQQISDSTSSSLAAVSTENNNSSNQERNIEMRRKITSNMVISAIPFVPHQQRITTEHQQQQQRQEQQSVVKIDNSSLENQLKDFNQSIDKQDLSIATPLGGNNKITERDFNQNVPNREQYIQQQEIVEEEATSASSTNMNNNDEISNVSSTATATSYETISSTFATRSSNKTMSWTSNHHQSSRKSMASVSVTATPSTNNNKSTSSSTTTTTNKEGNSAAAVAAIQQAVQVKNYGVMKTPSSPITVAAAANITSCEVTTTVATVNNERKVTGEGAGGGVVYQSQATIQNQEPGKVVAISTSSIASTAIPQQFQEVKTSSTVALIPPHTNDASNKKGNQSTESSNSHSELIKKDENNTITSTTSKSSIVANNVVVSSPSTSSSHHTTATGPPSWASLFANKSSNHTTTTTITGYSSASSFVATVNHNSITSVANSFSSARQQPLNKKPIAKVFPFEGTSNFNAPIVTSPGTMSYSAASAQGLVMNIDHHQHQSNTTNNVGGGKNQKSSSAATTTPSSSSNTDTYKDFTADEWSLKFADFLTKYKVDYSSVSLKPRGLTNRSNYCYINAILQALVGCPPFYNLMKSIPKQTIACLLMSEKSNTPTINAVMQLIAEFSHLPSGARLINHRREKGGQQKKDDLSTELSCDPSFEPTAIYNLWNANRSDVEGRQEDAEEFLGYVLNKLNDEMLEVIKLTAKPSKSEQNGEASMDGDDGGEDWQMIYNNRNKGSITRQTDFGRTPISDIFRGELRSRLQREGDHSVTDVIQPFFTLQLNIEKAASVKEALEILVGRDQLEGVTCSKTNQEVVAWQQMTLEKLPVILILHLKWFDYKMDGCTKIFKTIEFPVELKIDTKILASKKYSQKQKLYRLYAVVYHDGKEASKGHYITDVYHTGYSSWLRYDDSSVRPVSENNVLRPRSPRVPYLLYYRRCDTVPATQNTATATKNSNK